MSSTATFKTPAPGAYSPEKVHPQGERHAPAYSMGSRSRYRKRKYAHFYSALLNSSDLMKENKEIGISGQSGDPKNSKSWRLPAQQPFNSSSCFIQSMLCTNQVLVSMTTNSNVLFVVNLRLDL